MATNAAKRVRNTARPGSLLAGLIEQFHALLAWSETHVHNTAIGNPPTPLASASVKKLVGSRGLGPKGQALTGTTTNTQSVSTAGIGYGMSATEFSILERLWKEFNDARDLADSHGHVGLSNAVTGGGFNSKQLVDESSKRDPSGMLETVAPVGYLASDLPVGPERDDLAELIVQFNLWMDWFNSHGHAALGGVATGTVNASRIADFSGRDVTGVVVS